MIRLFTILFLIFSGISNAQDLNQIDSNGLRQGLWEKYYPNGNKQYEGYFRDNKPVGEWNRFYENGNIQAIITYSEMTDTAFTKLYNILGELNAEGNYVNEIREGVWKFYQNNILIRETEYKKNLKNGISRSYYETGELFEESEWINNLKDGSYKVFYKNSNPQFQCKYKYDLREGVFISYYNNGIVESEGFYSNNQREGEWRFFDENGDEIYRLEYNQGNLLNKHVLDSIQNQQFIDMEKNRNTIPDPEKFQDNPDEYLRQIR